jgi:hypothetical protein
MGSKSREGGVSTGVDPKARCCGGVRHRGLTGEDPGRSPAGLCHLTLEDQE